MRPEVGAVLGALGDPTRRAVYEAVARRGPLTPTELAERLPVSRQAVSKHLGVLAEAGLVRSERHGREARFEPVPRATASTAAWMDELGAAWDDRLGRLRRHLADG